MATNNPVICTGITLYEQGFIGVYIARQLSNRTHYVSHASHARYSRVQAKIGAGFDLSIWGRPSGYGGHNLSAAPAPESNAELRQAVEL